MDPILTILSTLHYLYRKEIGLFIMFCFVTILSQINLRKLNHDISEILNTTIPLTLIQLKTMKQLPLLHLLIFISMVNFMTKETTSILPL